MDASVTDLVPDLEFTYPDCTVCDDGGSITTDVGLYCEKCGTTWGADGTDGTLDESFTAIL